MKRGGPLKRRTPLRAVATLDRGARLKSVSPKKLGALAKYRCAKAEHFREHPGCQYPGGCGRSLLKGDPMDLHHAAGRNGPLLYTKKYFRTACRFHHERAKTQMSHSREIGWLIDVSSEEVRALRQAEILNLPTP